MIAAIEIHDLAAIRHLRLELGPGLTAITGASGAGKSLVTESLRLLFQGRGRGKGNLAQRVRRGAELARIQLTLAAGTDASVRAAAAEAGLPAWPDGEPLILERTIDRQGKTRVRAGGQVTRAAVFSRLQPLLVESFAQGEAAQLDDPEQQRRLLDRVAGLSDDVERYRAAREGALAQAEAHDRLLEQERRQRRLLERYADQVDALEALDPAPGELEALYDREAELERSRAEVELLNAAASELLSDEDHNPLTRLGQLQRQLERLAGGHHHAPNPGLGQACEALTTGLIHLHEASVALEEALDGAEGEPEELRRVRERIGEYRATGRLLGLAPEGLAQRWTELGGDVEERSRQREQLDRSLQRSESELQSLGLALGETRTAAAKRLERKARLTLAALGLEQARFAIAVAPLGASPAETAAKEEAHPEGWAARLRALAPSPNGPQSVQLRFAPDPDTELGPLDQASGGERSRVFLALARLSGAGSERLLVFDEVDQNVGARLGAAVGQALAEAAAGRQALVVTHLAPVAARADCHVRVARRKDGAVAEPLEGEPRVHELAAMIRGDATEAALTQARELLSEVAVPLTRAAPRPARKGARRGRATRVSA